MALLCFQNPRHPEHACQEDSGIRPGSHRRVQEAEPGAPTWRLYPGRRGRRLLAHFWVENKFAINTDYILNLILLALTLPQLSTRKHQDSNCLN